MRQVLLREFFHSHAKKIDRTQTFLSKMLNVFCKLIISNRYCESYKALYLFSARLFSKISTQQKYCRSTPRQYFAVCEFCVKPYRGLLQSYNHCPQGRGRVEVGGNDVRRREFNVKSVADFGDDFHYVE